MYGVGMTSVKIDNVDDANFFFLHFQKATSE